ncbi:MAG: gluconate 2-dehydrogenase subunit 3 family protein [Myxococcota bacterium]
MSQTTYSEQDKRTLAWVLDVIVPPSPDGRLPGAGEIGLADVIETKSPDLAPGVVAGLEALESLARERGVADLDRVPAADRPALLEALAESQPGFLPGLVFPTYVAYYEHPRVMEALGLEARPPHPLGYELEQGDLGLLDAVRARPKLYRDA